MQNLKRNFILIGLIVLFVFIPFKTISAADCKEILIYIFPGDSNGSDFNDQIITYLAEEGYNITITERSGTDELTPALLSSYGQIWIIDAGNDRANITSTEVDNIYNHYLAGNNVLLAGEEGHEKHEPEYQDDVHPIAQKFNTSMEAGIDDGTEYCNSNVNSTGSANSAFILNGVSSIATTGGRFGAASNLNITTTNPNVESVAMSITGIDLIYVSDGTERVVFHPSYYTFQNDGICHGHAVPGIEIGDSKQYAKNVANWLCHVAPPPPPTPPLPPISGGLIPCGRKTDNPDTPNVDERDECTICHFFLMIKNILDFVMKLAVIIAILFIVFGGILYIFSTGREDLLIKAKGMILWALAGFVLIFAAWIFIALILSVFGYTDPLGGQWDVIC